MIIQQIKDIHDVIGQIYDLTRDLSHPEYSGDIEIATENLKKLLGKLNRIATSTRYKTAY